MSTNEVLQENIEYPFFYDKEGNVPFWDHPFLSASKLLPKRYHPQTTLEGVLNLFKRKRYNEEDIVLLKVLGDAVCANEDQLRRYMSKIGMSRSDVSKRLDRLRETGMVDRWKVRIRNEEESIKPPAPFTLGIGGYKLLHHYYGEQSFMMPDHWDTLGVGGIKRYVAVNELRCRLIEAQVATKWSWNTVIANNPRLHVPLGAAEIKTPEGNINFLIDRAQMNQDFIGYFRDKLERWKRVYKKHENLPLSQFPANIPFVVIFTSTLSVAQALHKELMLDTFPFNVWLCVEEDMLKEGLPVAFYLPTAKSLKRIRLDFLRREGG